jgi:hypothetical protein
MESPADRTKAFPGTGEPDLEAVALAEAKAPPEARARLARLCKRRERFALAYLFGPERTRFNATRSAEAAGLRWPRQQGSRLLRSSGVGGMVEELFRRHHLGEPRGIAGRGADPLPARGTPASDRAGAGSDALGLDVFDDGGPHRLPRSASASDFGRITRPRRSRPTDPLPEF